MNITNGNQQLKVIIETNLGPENKEWIASKLQKIIDTSSVRDLYMTYTLIGSKVKAITDFTAPETADEVYDYIKLQKGNLQQITRIYLLSEVLIAAPDVFIPKVANLMSIADTGELEAFLKFMILLPAAENYKDTAVDALRTNIATIFDAIALNNPYPANFFNHQQWNQMFLKAAFMERDLNQILAIDQMANKDLTRIISDYAHERWAASREIDPYFWRPVTNHLTDALLDDMMRLLQSKNKIENRAGALCCFYSKHKKAKILLAEYPELQQEIASGNTRWETLKK